MTTTNYNANTQYEKIQALDLEPIKYKLVTEKEWTKELADKIEVAYKGFLFLNSQYPDATLVPTEEIDEMWHMHILDTLKYAWDCQHIFGGFLHHFPYFGVRDGVDAETLKQSSLETQDLFKNELGIEIDSIEYRKGNGAATTCGGGVSCGSAYKAATCGGGVSCRSSIEATTCGGGVSCGSILPDSFSKMQVNRRPTFGA